MYEDMPEEWIIFNREHEVLDIQFQKREREHMHLLNIHYYITFYAFVLEYVIRKNADIVFHTKKL